MTEAETADFKRLISDKAFLSFLYRIVQQSGVFTVATNGSDNRDLNFAEGRRSLALEILAEVERAQQVPSPDGLPVATSIQMFLHVAQSAAKEKPLGRRRDTYGDLGSDDGDDGE